MARFENTTFILGDWTVDSTLGHIQKGAETHTLRPGLMSVLVFLAENAEETVSSQDIIDGPWNGITVAESSVYRAISDLRKLLGDNTSARSYIKTIPRRGYCLIAPVEMEILARSSVELQAETPAPAETLVDKVPPAPVSQTSEVPAAVQKPRGRDRATPALWGVAALIIMSFVVSIAYVFYMQERPPAPVPEAERVSIAVLPLKNLTDDPRQDYLTDGISDELIDLLAQNQGLRVSARRSSFAFRGSDLDVREIGRQLKVQTVLEGSLRREGSQLTVTAQLINAETGFNVWSQSFEGSLDEVMLLQDRISAEIMVALRPYLGRGGPEASGSRKTSLTVYDTFLLGQHYLNQNTKGALIKSLAYFDQAISLDPEYVPAYVGKAAAYLALSETEYGSIPDEDALFGATVLIDEALAIDPGFVPANVAKGRLHFRANDFASATITFDRAIELDASSSEAHYWRGQIYLRQLNLGAATTAFDQAHSLDPLDLNTFTYLIQCLALLGETDKAEGLIQHYQQLAPDTPSTLTTAIIAQASGNWAEAYLAAKQASEESDHDFIQRQLSITLLNLGETEEAKALAPPSSPSYSLSGTPTPLVSRIYLDLPGTTLGEGNIWMNSAINEFLKKEFLTAANYFELAAQGNEAIDGPLFSVQPEQSRAPYLAYAWQHSGNHSRSLGLIETIRLAVERYEKSGAEAGHLILKARYAILIEDFEAAKAALREAEAAGALSWYILEEPFFDRLRTDEDFQALVAKVHARVDAERQELGWPPASLPKL